MRDLLARYQSLWHPNRYHGWGKRRNYFEGWYIKLVSPCEQYAFALIPGISMDKAGQQHAFVQVLDGKACQASYHCFKASDFRPERGRFALALGENEFAEQGVSLKLAELSGSLRFEGNTPWPGSLGAPGVMGWYSFVPFMQCYHGVVSMHHRLQGELAVYGRKVDFSGGIGYMEKDWGRSFPSSWIWMQSNHFPGLSKASLMVSVARIPWLGSHFVGFLAGWQHEGQLYRFTTYNGAKLSVQIDEAAREVHLDIERKPYRLLITAKQQGGQGELASPLSGAMAGKVSESLQSVLHLRFFEGQSLRYEGEGRHAGLELAGPAVEELATLS